MDPYDEGVAAERTRVLAKIEDLHNRYRAPPHLTARWPHSQARHEGFHSALDTLKGELYPGAPATGP